MNIENLTPASVNVPLAWMFIALAAIYCLGLAPRLARTFYPEVPGFRVRLAAPVIFAGLAIASFLGASVVSLIAVVIVGIPIVIGHRWSNQRNGRIMPLR